MAAQELGFFDWYQNFLSENSSVPTWADVKAAMNTIEAGQPAHNSTKPETSSQCVLLADKQCPYKITNTCIGCDQFTLA
jgi:hypothetical protein